MKRINFFAVIFSLIFVLPLVITVGGHFYIASQHVGPPTLEQLRAQYPTCEQRLEYVTAKNTERQEKSIASIVDSMPKIQFSDKPVTSLGEWWRIYREGTEKRLNKADEREFGDTLYDLGRGCWHD